MDSATRTVCFALVFVFLCLVCVGCAAGTAQQPPRSTSAKTKAELRREKEARAAEELRAKREAAARAEREAAAKAKAKREEKARAAEELRARREAAAKAKREAAAKAKAKRDEKARLEKLDADSKKQAKTEIAQAKREKQASLSRLDATAKAQAKKKAEEIKAGRARLKRRLDEDKAKAAAEHKQAVARAKKDKAKLEAEAKQYKRTIAQLDAEYKGALAKLKAKADAKAAEIAQAKSDNKAELATLDTKAKRQAKESKAEQAKLKRDLDADKARMATEHKQVVARAKKNKAKLEAEYTKYKQTVARLDAEYKAALAKLKEKADAQAAQIAQAKRENKAELATLDAKAKRQAKEIDIEKANLKRKLRQDRSKRAAEYKQAKARPQTKEARARLDAEYKRALRQLESEYKRALAGLEAKADAQAGQIAAAKRGNKARLAEIGARAKEQAKDIKTQEANLKSKLSQDKNEAKKYGIAKLDADYKEALGRREAEYREALTRLKKKTANQAADQAAQIAEAKRENKARLADLGAGAKEQAKEIKTQEANLKSKLSQDKNEAKIYGIAKLDADYKDKIGRLETEYKQALARFEEKADVQGVNVAEQRKQIEADYQEKVARINLRLRLRKQEAQLAELKLPQDTTPLMTVRELRINGNSLVSTAELLKDMPLVYNASDKPLREADSEYLYDFRVLHDVIQQPGQTRQVSARTIQGFTQYVLSMYQDKNYAGVYVYVPAEAVERKSPAELKGGILPIEVLEAEVTDIVVRTYDPDQNPTEKGYLRTSAVKEWSPVQVGDVTNQKELDEFVNLLNLNPDRYVSAVASKGREANSLMVSYDIYEANPWHYFLQADNSGTRERRWNPRIGIINTNLLGIDDTFTTVYQAPWDSEIDENYTLYGSYDFPVLGPRLRLNLYAGHSEFDISPETGLFGFLGRGTVYGGTLRYNVLQTEGWFFDVKGTMEHTRSKITPSLFPGFLGTDIQFWLWGGGLDVHRQDDMSDTSLSFDHFKSLGGESSAAEFALARTNAQTLFSIYSASATHSQYLDPNKVGRASGTFRWVGSDERLVPARMTAFGGMYTVRGYDEYEFVADGGILASAQYEFDLVKYEESKKTTEAGENPEEGKKPFLKKLAPLAFVDYGRAKIRNRVGIEKEHEELFSVGAGTIVELGDNFSGAVYYGYPLAKTDTTRKGKGRVSVGLMLRW
ncbi:MAG: ShlB/FhaC/HecB family protein [Planctomycetota bacterium]|jgi:hemolysin activation/secretion protein